jgi:hypothetical protein
MRGGRGDLQFENSAGKSRGWFFVFQIPLKKNVDATSAKLARRRLERRALLGRLSKKNRCFGPSNARRSGFVKFLWIQIG